MEDFRKLSVAPISGFNPRECSSKVFIVEKSKASSFVFICFKTNKRGNFLVFFFVLWNEIIKQTKNLTRFWEWLTNEKIPFLLLIGIWRKVWWWRNSGCDWKIRSPAQYLSVCVKYCAQWFGQREGEEQGTGVKIWKKNPKEN